MSTTTSAEKYTQGPWSVVTKGSKHFIDGADELTVAYLDRAGVRNRVEIEANAAAISAVPDLIAACRSFVALFGSEIEWHVTQANRTGQKLTQAIQARVDALDAAKRALAKASAPI